MVLEHDEHEEPCCSLAPSAIDGKQIKITSCSETHDYYDHVDKTENKVEKKRVAKSSIYTYIYTYMRVCMRH